MSLPDDVILAYIFPYLSFKEVAICQRVCKYYQKVGNEYFPFSKYRSINAACRDVLRSTRCSYLPHEVLPSPAPLSKSQVEAFLQCMDQDPFLDVATDELKCILQVAVKMHMDDFVFDKIREIGNKYLGHKDVLELGLEFMSDDEWEEAIFSHSCSTLNGYYQDMLELIMAYCFQYENPELFYDIKERALCVLSPEDEELWGLLTSPSFLGNQQEGSDNFERDDPKSIDILSQFLVVAIFTGKKKLIMFALERYNQAMGPPITLTAELDDAIDIADSSSSKTVLEVFELLKLRHSIDLRELWKPISYFPSVLLSGFRFCNLVRPTTDRTLPSPLVVPHLIFEGNVDVVSEILKDLKSPSDEFIIDLLALSLKQGYLELSRYFVESFPDLCDKFDEPLQKRLLKSAINSRLPKVVKYAESLTHTVHDSFEDVADFISEGLYFDATKKMIEKYRNTHTLIDEDTDMTYGEQLLEVAVASENLELVKYLHQDWNVEFTASVLGNGTQIDHSLVAKYILDCIDVEIVLSGLEKREKFTKREQSIIFHRKTSHEQKDILQFLHYIGEIIEAPAIIDHPRLLEEWIKPQWIECDNFMFSLLMMVRCIDDMNQELFIDYAESLMGYDRMKAMDLQGLKLLITLRAEWRCFIDFGYVNNDQKWPKIVLYWAHEQIDRSRTEAARKKAQLLFENLTICGEFTDDDTDDELVDDSEEEALSM